MGTFSEQESAVMQAGLNWADAIAKGDLDKILSLYDARAILLGTLSLETRKDPDALREYFMGFCCRENMRGEFTDHNIRIFGDIAVNSGTYAFIWTLEGKRVRIPARFTFVYKKTGEGWKIIEHHSSLVPDPAFDPTGYILD